ncbi:hypothetical protein [Cytobacillus firmus]|uniref:Uncharacterized protein n=1 Tax=Cytobacillus firmus DS1 TaxID=1307436 RepID=W7LAQ1_CYTFI|nr:hypothetical protein [Cytobacillus firmus]EWG08909.1 hypothetical protein PBF_22133 [Cytobacillus firmus DS1]
MVIQFARIDEEHGRIIGIDYIRKSTQSENEIVFEEELPSNAPQEFGKTTNLILNLITNEITFEFINRPLTPEEKIAQLEKDLGNVLFESAADKAKISELEIAQGDLLMEIAMLKMGGNA